MLPPPVQPPLPLFPQVLVRSLVSELHELSDILTLEQLSAVASSLVVLLPLLGEHGRGQGQQHDATGKEGEGQSGQGAPAEELHLICSPEQVQDFAAALPLLTNNAVSKHSLPAVLNPVCQAYGSMLQLLQLTHTNSRAQTAGALTLEGARTAVALYGFLSRTVLCAPDLARQLGRVGMGDLHVAVQVAVQYRLALPPGILDVPSSFWDAVRQRTDKLVGAAREGTAAVAAEATEGQGGGATGSLDAQSLAGMLGAMCRDLAAKREAERASGGETKMTKGPGDAEASWLAETTALVLRSHQPGKQNSWSELVEGVASAQKQLAEAEQDLKLADEDRHALLQAREVQQQQQRQQQTAKRKKAKAKAAAKPAEGQQSGEEGAEDEALAKAEDVYTYSALMVKDAKGLVEDKKGELLALRVVGLREQLAVEALLQLAGEVAEAAKAAETVGGAGRGVTVGVSAALEGLVQGRLRELHPAQLMQVGGEREH